MRSIPNFLRITRSFCSGFESTKLLIPLVLRDFSKGLENISDIESNLSHRNRIAEIDLKFLDELLKICGKEDARKKLFKNPMECNPYEMRQFESFNMYMKHFKTMVLHYFLTLPNVLHERTPCEDESKVILTKSFSDSNMVTNDHNDHVLAGHKLDVLRFEDKATYFLKKDAALLELAVVRFISDLLQNEYNFKPFRNPDTCNEFVLRGTVVDELLKHALFLQNSFYPLIGSASLSTFCAARVETSVHVKFMPERFFTCGRKYVPSSNETGLYGVCQRTDCHFFVTTSTADGMMYEFDKILALMVNLYEKLELDFRICYNKAAELTLAESCRATIQLYSIQEKKYVDVARISIYGNFISKRLKILCHNAKNDSGFVYIVDGIAISVPTLIANLLERSTDHLFIPECLRPYMLGCDKKKEDTVL